LIIFLKREQEQSVTSQSSKRLVAFYLNGFRSMPVGRTLWKIILIKLFILFAVLKVFFFPNYLQTHFSTDAERASYVLETLTRNAP